LPEIIWLNFFSNTKSGKKKPQPSKTQKYWENPSRVKLTLGSHRLNSDFFFLVVPAAPPVLLFVLCYWDRASLSLPGWSQTRDLPASTFLVARITDACHRVCLKRWL
jgi:hypothetical protein